MRELPDEIMWGDPPNGLWLATTNDAVEAFSPVAQRLGEIVPLIEAEGASAEDYANVSTSITLRVLRQHDTPSACRLFMLMHLKEFGAIAVREEPRALIARYMGSTFRVERAIVTGISAEDLGASCRHTYTIIGGPVT